MDNEQQSLEMADALPQELSSAEFQERLKEIGGDTKRLGQRLTEEFRDDLSLDRKLLNGDEYNHRDSVYTRLLEYYIERFNEKSMENLCYKKSFFISVMVVFTVAILGSLITLIILASKENFSASDIGTVFGAAASGISAIIILPKIIAEHLFPTNEDQNMISLVQKMQENDGEIRKNICENNKYNKDK